MEMAVLFDPAMSLDTSDYFMCSNDLMSSLERPKHPFTFLQSSYYATGMLLARVLGAVQSRRPLKIRFRVSMILREAKARWY